MYTAQLVNILPTLALVGMALTGIESAPVSSLSLLVAFARLYTAYLDPLTLSINPTPLSYNYPFHPWHKGSTNKQNALAHGAQRRDHHKHLAARHRLETQVSKKRSTGLVRRGADGTVCRVRGSAPPAPSPAAAESVAAAPSPAAPSPSAEAEYSEAAAAPSEAAAAPSEAAAPSSDAAWSAPASSSAAAAPATSEAAPAPAPASNGGWSNAGDKYGMAWPNGDWSTQGQSDYIGNYIGSRASWYYTWSPHSVVSSNRNFIGQMS